MTRKTIVTNQPTEIAELHARLREAEDTLEAIRSGAIDAIVVEGENQQQIFTLKSADYTYRMLIESMNQGAITISEDGTILYSNRQFGNMMGVPLEQIIGSLIQDYIAPKDRKSLTSLIKKPGLKDQELTLRIDHTPYMVVMISATKLPFEESTAYMYMVITDITERKKAEDAKDEFISLASHQLRTPATGVKQYPGMLLEGYAGELSEKNRLFIKTAYDSNERQLTIINDILKTAQIDSGLYEMIKAPEDLRAIVDTVVEEYAPIFSSREQRVVVEATSPVTANVDKNELQLAISNVIENASKYSPKNSQISIKLYMQAKHACIAIKDHGVGISESDTGHIFDKFTRIDNPLSDTVSGSGLGLYWVKRIILMHEGDIAVESSSKHGSTFTISLPL
jgi:PAS domain S-box-containing protein